MSLLALLIAATMAARAWATVRVWNEAYGAGPPYYGRTTNMDKWQDPSAELFWVNGTGLAVTARPFAVMCLKLWRWL